MSRIANLWMRLVPVSAVESLRRVIAYSGRAGSPADGARAATPRTRATTRGAARRTQSVRDLSAKGISIAEIARRTRISQDAVAMLLNLAPQQPVDSAADGTFFRILQARTAA